MHPENTHVPHAVVGQKWRQWVGDEGERVGSVLIVCCHSFAQEVWVEKGVRGAVFCPCLFFHAARVEVA